MVREASDREFNNRAKASGGISKEINDMGKDLDMYQD